MKGAIYLKHKNRYGASNFTLSAVKAVASQSIFDRGQVAIKLASIAGWFFSAFLVLSIEQYNRFLKDFD